MRRVVKWGALVVGGLVLVVALAAFGLLLYMRSDTGHAWLREILETRGRSQWPGLHIGQLGGDLLHELWLRDVTIRDAQGRPAVHVDRVDVRYRLAGLLQRRVDIVSLRLSGPALLVRPLDDGSLNIQHLSQPPSPAAAGPAQPTRGQIRVQDLRLHDGHADVLLADGRRMRVSDLHLSSSGTVRRGDIDVGATDLRAVAAVDGRAYELSLHARGRVSTDGVDLDVARASVAGLIEEGALVLTARVKGPRDRVAVNVDVQVPPLRSFLRAHGTVGLHGAELGDYDLHIEAHQVDPHWFASGAPAGQVGARLAVQGSGTPLQPGSSARVYLVAEPSRLAGYRIRELRLTAESQGVAWTLHDALLRGGGLGISLHGHGAGHDLSAELQARVGTPEDGPVALPDFRGRGELQASVHGRFPSALTVNLSAQAAQLAVGQTRVAALQARGTLSGGLHRPSGHLMVAAKNVHAGGRVPDVSRLALDVTGNGRELTVTARAHGPRLQSQLAATLRMEADEIVARVQTLQLALLERDWAEDLRLLAPTVVRWASGRRLDIENLRVQGKGTYTGWAGLDGWLELGRVPRGRATLVAHNVQLPGVDRFAGQAQAVLAVGQGDLRLDLNAGRARLHVDARVPLTQEPQPRLAPHGPVSIHAASNQLRLEHFPLLGRRLARHGVGAGMVDVVARVEGDVARPDAHVRLGLHALELRLVTGLGPTARLRRIPALDGVVTLDSQPGALRGRLQLATQAGATLQAQGHLERDLGALLAGGPAQDAPLELNADLRRLDLASLSQLDDRLLNVGGMLVASARLRGTLARPLGEADAVLTAGRVDKLRLGPVQVHADLRSDGTHVRVDVAEVAGGQLHAQADVDRADRLRAQLRARDLDPAFARLFWAQLREAGGQVDADVQAEGPLQTPDLRGTLTWRRGRLGLVGQPTFGDVSADLRLTTGRVDLTKVHASSAGGSVDAKGFALLHGFVPVQIVLTAHANRFVVAAGGASGVRLNGDFAVDAALHESVLSGQVRVPRATLWLPSLDLGGRQLQDIGPRDDVHFVDEAAKAAEEKRRQAPSAPLRLDLQATADNVQVRGKDLDLDVVSNLHVGTAPNGSPALTGTIEIRRGRIDVSGQRFDFDYGRVAFDGSPVPRLDIRVTHQFAEALAIVELRGTPQKPELRLTSDPPNLDQAQIVSLILTGQAGGQPSTDSAFDPKAAVASALLGQIAGKLAPRLGVDVLRVQSAPPPAEAAAAGTPGTRLEVGKYISSRVYLSYAHVFGASVEQNANEASVEYRISRGWILETIFGDAGVGSVDALWMYRY